MTENDRITEGMQVALNLEWYACDRDGSIASFETGGFARMPESVLASNSERKALIYYFYCAT